jgi:hypothetical protein
MKRRDVTLKALMGVCQVAALKRQAL